MENLYYSTDGQEQKGPVSKDNFLQMGLSPNTLVWFEGQSGWMRAGDIPALQQAIPQLAYSATHSFGATDQATPTLTADSIPYSEPSDLIRIDRRVVRGVLLGVGSLLVLVLLYLFISRRGNHSPEREPFVQTYASNFAGKLMKATYPFSGRNPRYEVKKWEFDDGTYTIDMDTYWSGSCTIFDNPCDVGWTVRLTVSEEGTFRNYEILERNGCAVSHQVCETALGTVVGALQNQSLGSN